MLKLHQFEIYDQAKKLLLYAEAIVEHHIHAHDDLLARTIKSALVTLVADLARYSSLDEEQHKQDSKKEAVALIHEIAAGFDIAHDKQLISDETFNKLEEKLNTLFVAIKKDL